MLNTITITDMVAQGFSKPHHYQKMIANTLWKTIAPFALLNVREDLFEELPKWQKQIAIGTVFSSLALRG